MVQSYKIKILNENFTMETWHWPQIMSETNETETDKENIHFPSLSLRKLLYTSIPCIICTLIRKVSIKMHKREILIVVQLRYKVPICLNCLIPAYQLTRHRLIGGSSVSWLPIMLSWRQTIRIGQNTMIIYFNTNR